MHIGQGNVSRQAVFPCMQKVETEPASLNGSEHTTRKPLHHVTSLKICAKTHTYTPYTAF